MAIQQLARAGFLATLACLVATRAHSQIEIGFPTIAFGPSSGCSNAPAVCQGVGFVPAPGPIDVYVYPMEGYSYPLRECAFGLVWPSEWQLIGVDICQGTIVQGGFSSAGGDVRLRFQPPVPADQAVLHFTFNATTIGRIQFTRGPGGAYGYDIDGFQNYIGADWGRFPYADVGDICGGVAIGYTCSRCRFIEGLYEPAATFTPPSLALTVEQGQTATALLEVDSSASCMPSTMCSEGWPPIPDFCYNGLEVTTPWLSFVPLTPGGPNLLRFEVRADATNLPPGLHLGSVEAEVPADGRGCCEAACFELELTVTPSTTSVPEPSVRETTWGRIKAVHE